MYLIYITLGLEFYKNDINGKPIQSHDANQKLRLWYFWGKKQKIIIFS